VKILIVEDSLADRELLVFALQENFKTEAKFREADSLKSAHDYLRRGGFDCVILDLHLPDSSGIDTFLLLHDAYPDVPIVVVSNTNDFRLALRMIRLGADDFIVKNFTDPDMVFRRVAFAIERNSRDRPPPSILSDIGDLGDLDDDPPPDTLPSRADP